MKTVLHLPDLHFRAARNGLPTGHDPKTLKVVTRYIKDTKPDRIILAGDILDLPYFSNYEKVPLKEGVAYYEEDADIARRQLAEWRGLCRNLDVIQGNHDYRGERIVRENPHLKKVINVARDLGLQGDRRVRFVRFWEDRANLVRIGKAAFGHGIFTNQYHAAKHASRYPGINFFYAHVHDIQSYDPAVFGHGSTNTAQSLGFLGRYDQGWNHNAPSNWQQAITKFHFANNGLFQHYIIRIFNHKFISPEGREYK